MSLGLTDVERKQRFYRNLGFWVMASLAGPLICLVINIQATLFVPEALPAVHVLIPVFLVFGVLWSMAMFPVVFIEWFPDSYYEGLKDCPVCGEKEAVKCVDECLCFKCGAKNQIEAEA